MCCCVWYLDRCFGGCCVVVHVRASCTFVAAIAGWVLRALSPKPVFLHVASPCIQESGPLTALLTSLVLSSPHHDILISLSLGSLLAICLVHTRFCTDPEIMSVVNTTFILWFVLPPCVPVIIDFFHKFTVHIDGLGFFPFSTFRMVTILSVALTL